MKNIRSVLFLSLGALPLAASAADLGSAKDFNAFIFGSATTTGHSDGAVAVGGSWSGTYDAYQHTSDPGPTVPGLSNVGLVVGGTSALSGSLGTGKNAYFAGANAGTISNAANVFTNSSLVSPSFFTSQKGQSEGQASAISGLGTNFGNLIELKPGGDPNSMYQVKNHAGTILSYGDSNNLNVSVSAFTPVSTVTGQSVYVFNIDKSLVDGSNPNLQINWNGLDGNSTLLVNVLGGGTVTWGVKNSANNINRILYSFGTATSLSIGGSDSFNGSILAPDAFLTQTKNIQGNLIANGWSAVGSPELHFGSQYEFAGYVPQAVPEPGAWAALGFGALAALRRRRK